MPVEPTDEKSVAAIRRFKEEICDRSDEIDPDELFDWYELSIGFFLACGLSMDLACEAACWVRYGVKYFS